VTWHDDNTHFSGMTIDIMLATATKKDPTLPSQPGNDLDAVRLDARHRFVRSYAPI
jgi:hypothetical protein